MKLANRTFLTQGFEQARQEYNTAKKDAKMRVRKAKNEVWIRLGEEME